MPDFIVDTVSSKDSSLSCTHFFLAIPGLGLVFLLPSINHCHLSWQQLTFCHSYSWCIPWLDPSMHQLLLPWLLVWISKLILFFLTYQYYHSVYYCRPALLQVLHVFCARSLHIWQYSRPYLLHKVMIYVVHCSSGCLLVVGTVPFCCTSYIKSTTDVVQYSDYVFLPNASLERTLGNGGSFCGA